MTETMTCTSNWEGYNEGKFCGVYPVSQLTFAMEELLSHESITIASTGKLEFFNIPCAFDIETSSFYNANDEKCATMYIWQFGIDGLVIYGRTWEEFTTFLGELVDYLELSARRRLVIYVHNLGYEFQFMRKWFDWDKVFAIKKRRPVYAICGPFEFRCSLFLSNYALAYIGDNLLHKYPVKKLVGNLDYSKIRHSATPLTSEELAYCFNDVRVVMSYIQEKIEQDGGITEIPLTNTGYVRNYCRSECFGKGESRKKLLDYHALMKSLKISSEDEYHQLERVFMGGFTHASAIWSNKIITTPGASFHSEYEYDEIGSADLTSSYPYVMVAEYFPITSFSYVGTLVNKPDFESYLSTYCCIFDIEFVDLKPKVSFENTLSLSRCDVSGGKSTINNGRIVSADFCRTTLTELDYDTVKKFYTWSKQRIINLRIAHRGYLPKDLILAVLNLYKDKTTLKGVIGKETEYLVAKNMINAAFGMMVTAIIRGEYQYSTEDDEWRTLEADVLSQLTSYNKNFNRFLYYGWGIYVTAHARHNLFTAIYEFKEDYIYSDTDSIKAINFSAHKSYFKRYNDEVFIKLQRMCHHYSIPFEMCKPKTKKGVEKLIGVWDFEPGYLAFKTAGAKRYMYELPDGSLSMTVAGVNKKYAIPYLLEKYGSHELIFNIFGDGMFIPEGHTGKQSLTYIDEVTTGAVTDYLGSTKLFFERSSIHMEPQSFYMSLIGDYLKFLEGVEYVEL